MFNNQKGSGLGVHEKKQMSSPTFLKEDYSYKAIGNKIIDISVLEPGSVYEIKCPACEMSIRLQGQKLCSTYARFENLGCLNCGHKESIIRKIDMNKVL